VRPPLSLGDPRPIKFGGEGGVAILASEGSESPSRLLVKGDGGPWAVALITHALLDEPVDVDNASSPRRAEEVAGALLRGHGCAGHATVLAMPKGELEPGVYMVGWSISAGRPREPRLVIPAGTVIMVEAERRCVERVAEHGLGDHGDLGWGSIAAASPGQQNPAG